MRWSARITACLLRAGPIKCSMRGTLCQLMFMPRPISGTRIWASLAITRKSSATAKATPPPTQEPSIAPIVTCSMSCQARVSRGPSFRCRRSAPRSMDLRDRPSGSLRSKPALNDLAPPVSTTTEVAPSSSKLRAASVSWRSASGDIALMPSPRSKRTTAMRPSGPRSFSIFTKSANAQPPCPLIFRNLSAEICRLGKRRGAFESGSQMAGPLAGRLAAGHRETDRGAERDPVGVLARDVAAIDQIDRENFVRPVTHAGLKPRLDHARRIRSAGLAERFDRPLQGFGELPVEPDSVEQIMAIDAAVPEPAAIQVDAHRLAE